jgi:NAD-dependent SIR2 family protein deacetylase
MVTASCPHCNEKTEVEIAYAEKDFRFGIEKQCPKCYKLFRVVFHFGEKYYRKIGQGFCPTRRMSLEVIPIVDMPVSERW